MTPAARKVILLRRSTAASGNVSPALDGITTGLTGAWSMSRKLLTAYAGSLYDLTGSEVLNFYDQSGNTRNLTSSAGKRCDVVSAGSLARAALGFDSDDQYTGVATSNFIGVGAGFLVMTVQFDSVATNAANMWENASCWNTNDASSIVGFYAKSTGNIFAWNWDGSADSVSNAMSTGSLHVLTWRHEGGTLFGSIDGGTEGSTASGNSTTLGGTFNIGVNPNYAGTAFTGKIVELAVYSTVPSAGDRASIVTNFKSYSGIT